MYTLCDYLCNYRILNRQEVLNGVSSTAKQRREAVKRYKLKEQTYFEHRQERERLAMRVKLLQQQLKEQQLTEKTGKEMILSLSLSGVEVLTKQSDYVIEQNGRH